MAKCYVIASILIFRKLTTPLYVSCIARSESIVLTDNPWIAKV
jgi:hypothetical protein